MEPIARSASFAHCVDVLHICPFRGDRNTASRPHSAVNRLPISAPKVNARKMSHKVFYTDVAARPSGRRFTYIFQRLAVSSRAKEMGVNATERKLKA